MFGLLDTYAVTIEGVTYMPFSVAHLGLARNACDESKPYTLRVTEARCVYLGRVTGERSMTMCTAQDRSYTALQRAFWQEHGLTLPIYLHKSYVPWWASLNSDRSNQR